MADCGLRRIGALMGLGRIAECTLGALQYEDARRCRCVAAWVAAKRRPKPLCWSALAHSAVTVARWG
eukprot:2824649-Alexandrium_andersonii.AAC.1